MKGVGLRATVGVRRRAFAVGVLLLCLVPSTAGQESLPRYTDLLAAYKRGEGELALSGLKRLTSSVDGTKTVTDWVSAARRSSDVARLQLALILHTEGALEGLGERATLGLRSWLDQLDVVRRLVVALRDLTPRSAFLRNWYLLWESILQAASISIIPVTGDYLPYALQDFPDDSAVLLTAGCRYEMLWWRRSTNPRRLASGGDHSDGHLRTAADFLRRSVRADPAAQESRLRLGRILFLLSEFRDAEVELRASVSPAVEPALRYLGMLFLGDLLERRGDAAAAIAAYAAAIGLVPVDQTARVAAAQLAHKAGRRLEAAEAIARALDRPATGFDPWWTYIRGQAWRFEELLLAGQAMVRR